MEEQIIKIFYSISGFVVGAIVGYKIRILTHKHTKFIDACVEFEQSFAETIQWLKDNTNGSRFSGDFKRFKNDHIIAINKFRVYLSKRKRTDFDIARNKFFNEKYGHYYGGYEGDKKVASELALKNLNELLHFAKH